MKKKVKYIIMVLAIIIIDQIVKIIITSKTSINLTIIPGALKLSYVENTGGAYGLGADSILVLIGINILLITFIITILTKSKKLDDKIKTGLLLILAGGISNLLDRLLRGYVIDYIDINEIINYPVFNIADVSIVCGAIIIIVRILIETVREQENEKKGNTK